MKMIIIFNVCLFTCRISWLIIVKVQETVAIRQKQQIHNYAKQKTSHILLLLHVKI